jgi:hypothetical protein
MLPLHRLQQGTTLSSHDGRTTADQHPTPRTNDRPNLIIVYYPWTGHPTSVKHIHIPVIDKTKERMSEGLFSRQIVELLIQSDENRIELVYLQGLKLRLCGQEYEWYYFDLSSGGVDAWKNLATTINNSQVYELWIEMQQNPEDDRPTAECYEAFLGELKNNKTIKALWLHLDHQIISMFLGYFLKNNSKMREPESKCEISFFGKFVTPEQIYGWQCTRNCKFY